MCHIQWSVQLAVAANNTTISKVMWHFLTHLERVSKEERFLPSYSLFLLYPYTWNVRGLWESQLGHFDAQSLIFCRVLTGLNTLKCNVFHTAEQVARGCPVGQTSNQTYGKLTFLNYSERRQHSGCLPWDLAVISPIIKMGARLWSNVAAPDRLSTMPTSRSCQTRDWTMDST